MESAGKERERERGKKIVHGVEFGERKLGQRRRPGFRGDYGEEDKCGSEMISHNT